MKSLRICGSSNLPTVAENMYRSMTAINQLLTGRNKTGSGGCVDYTVWTEYYGYDDDHKVVQIYYYHIFRCC